MVTTSEAATSQAQGICNFATGSITSANLAIDVTLGFQPRHVRVFNETDVIMWEKFEAQAAANSVKTTNVAVMTKDTGSAILIKGGNVDGDTYRGFQISSTAAGNSKVLHWAAWG